MPKTCWSFETGILAEKYASNWDKHVEHSEVYEKKVKGYSETHQTGTVAVHPAMQSPPASLLPETPKCSTKQDASRQPRSPRRTSFGTTPGTRQFGRGKDRATSVIRRSSEVKAPCQSPKNAQSLPARMTLPSW